MTTSSESSMSSAFTFEVVLMRHEHIAGAVALQRACFPQPFPEELLWREEHLARHIEVFPEGQFVAIEAERVVGSASNLLLNEETWQRHATWEETVGGPFFANHTPYGSTLYGADISVAPAHRAKGVGRALYNARFDLVRSHKLVRYGTACRIPNYLSFHECFCGTTKQYIAVVLEGKTTDRTLTPLLRFGLSYVATLENYMLDEESGNAGVLLEWLP